MTTTQDFRVLNQKIKLYFNTILSLETTIEKLKKEKSDLVISLEDFKNNNKKLKKKVTLLEEEIQALKGVGGHNE